MPEHAYSTPMRFSAKRYNFNPRFSPQKKTSREIWHWLPVPKRARSVPEPAAPSSCHRGDAPGSAGPRSSAKTATQPCQEGQDFWLSWLAPEFTRLGDKGSVKQASDFDG